MSVWPRVSIITPSLNQAAFIQEAIESVLAQEYPNMEYLVIDGASTDGTVEILKRYADRLNYWVSEPDRGQSHALNKGLAAASGDIVGWLNADDLYLPGSIKEAVSVFQGNPDVDVVFGKAVFIDTCGGELGVFPARAIVHNDLLQSLPIPQPAAFIRVSALRLVGGLDEGYHYAMDTHLWLRLLRRGSCFMYVPRRWAAMRIHPEAKSIRVPFMWWQEFARMLNELFLVATEGDGGESRAVSFGAPIVREAIGRACWHAAWHAWLAGERGVAKANVQRAVQMLPSYLAGSEFRDSVLYELLASVRREAVRSETSWSRARDGWHAAQQFATILPRSRWRSLFLTSLRAAYFAEIYARSGLSWRQKAVAICQVAIAEPKRLLRSAWHRLARRISGRRYNNRDGCVRGGSG